MPSNAPIAIVDIYDAAGLFVRRVDFAGVYAESAARNYAESSGTIVTSGTTVSLNDLKLGPAVSQATFIPDIDGLNTSRLDATDTKFYDVALTVKVFVVQQPKLPHRNPLHPKALTLDELTIGLNIQRYHRRGPISEVAVIIDRPFQNSDLVWMVKVATKDWTGKLAIQEWYPADMGTVPHEFNGKRFWNETHYTLAV